MKRVWALVAALLFSVPAGAVTYGAPATSSDGLLEYWYDLSFATVRIGYLDSADIGNWNTGEPIFLHLESSGSTATVLATDIRLDQAAGRPTATEIGKTLTFTTGGTPLADLLIFVDQAPAWNAGGPNNALGVGDGLYIDLDNSDTATAGDLRLAPFGSHAAFTFVGGSDAEVTETFWSPDAGDEICVGGKIAPALTTTCPAGGRTITVAYLDDGATADTYDANEHLYISADTTVSTGDIRVHHSTAGLVKKSVVCTGVQDADCGTTLKLDASAHVTHKAKDYSAVLAAATKTLKDVVFAIDANGNGKFDTADAISWAFAGKRMPVAGDLRIVPMAGATAGTWLVPAAHETISLLSTGGLVVWYQDSDNGGTVSVGEPMVIRPAGTALAAGDVRLVANGNSCPLGSQRVITDTCDTALWKVVPSGFSKVVATGGTEAGADASDNVYLAASTTLAAGDLKIRGAGAPKLLTPGDSNEVGTTATDLGTPMFVDTDASGGWSYGDSLYVDTNSNGVVDALDFRFYAPGLTSFAWVGVNNADATWAGSALSGAGIQIVDIEGNGPSIGDGLFLHTASATATGFGHVRIAASPWGFAAGTRLSGIDPDHNEAFHSSATNYLVKYIDLDSSGSPSPGDRLYVSISGGSTVGVKDVRITTFGNHAAGTYVVTSHADCCSTPLGTVAQKFGSLDVNGDRKTDTTDVVFFDHDQTDMQTATSTTLVFAGPGDFWLSGTGGATTSGSTGSGGSTATSTQTGTVTVTPTTTVSTSTTTTTTITTGITRDTVAAWNQNIRSSLTVERQEGGNFVSWDSQQGPSGHQVFRADSPYSLVTQLQPGASSYLDAEGEAGSTYLVTAFFHTGAEMIGFIADPNTEDIPGLGVAPAGIGVGDKKSVPGLGILLVLGVLAGLVAMRRRL